MNKRAAKIEALRRTIGLVDVQLRSSDDGDLLQGLDKLSDGDRAKVEAAIDTLINEMAERLARLRA